MQTSPAFWIQSRIIGTLLRYELDYWPRNRVRTSDSPPITPQDLSSALYAAGSLRKGAILSVKITEQIDTTISHLWYLEVDYAVDSAPNLPNRLILKWPVDGSPAQGESEPRFYRELAPALTSPPT